MDLLILLALRAVVSVFLALAGVYYVVKLQTLLGAVLIILALCLNPLLELKRR